MKVTLTIPDELFSAFCVWCDNEKTDIITEVRKRALSTEVDVTEVYRSYTNEIGENFKTILVGMAAAAFKTLYDQIEKENEN